MGPQIFGGLTSAPHGISLGTVASVDDQRHATGWFSTKLFAAVGCGEQEKIAQGEQKMPDGRVRCELCEGFRAVRELQQDEPRRAGASEHVIYFPPARAAGSRSVSVLRFRPAVRSVGASPSDPLQLGQTEARLLPSPTS